MRNLCRMRGWCSSWRQILLADIILLPITVAMAGCYCGMTSSSKTLSSTTTRNQGTGVSSWCIDSPSPGRNTSVLCCSFAKRWLRSLPPVLFVIRTTFHCRDDKSKCNFRDNRNKIEFTLLRLLLSCCLDAKGVITRSTVCDPVSIRTGSRRERMPGIPLIVVRIAVC